jgi:type IV fimbrial biogenesis protein FimT
MERMRIKPNLNRSDNPRQVGVCFQLFYCKEQRGFSLLEMMIVVVIIGVLAAIGMPAYSTWKQQQAVSNAASSLLAHLKQARSLAVAENRSVSITFSSTAYTFDADTAISPAPPCGPCRNEAIDYSQFSTKLSISPTTTRTFKSRGTANSGTMTLSASGNSEAITVNIIGRARLQ